MHDHPDDDELLTARDPDAFGAFYVRHQSHVQRYFMTRVGDAQVAADLTAETFACALVARRRFVSGEVPATAGLYAIASRRLVDLHRRRAAEERLHTTLAAHTRLLPTPSP